MEGEFQPAMMESLAEAWVVGNTNTALTEELQVTLKFLNIVGFSGDNILIFKHPIHNSPKTFR